MRQRTFICLAGVPIACLGLDTAQNLRPPDLYQRSLEIDEKALGPDHPDLAATLNNLAGLYQAQGRYQAAEPLYVRALKILDENLGPDHANTKIIRESLKSLREKNE